MTQSHFDNAWDLHMILNTVGEPVVDPVNVGLESSLFTSGGDHGEQMICYVALDQINIVLFALVLVG